MKALQIQDVSKKYGKIEAIRHMSFDVHEGEILGLLGPNGAGKSTMLSMITTLIKPDGGDILYHNNSIHKNPREIQTEMGYVPQEIALYELLTGRENLIFWGGINGIEKKALILASQQIIDLIGLSDRIDDLVSTYSGGMKRRLNIGVALLHEPKLLILDEPTVGIDPQSRQYILDTIRTINKEKATTVIFSSHYMDEIESICDRLCIIDEGKLIATGTKTELIKFCQLKTFLTMKLSKSCDNEIHSEIDKKNLLKVVENLDFVDSIKLNKDKIILEIVNEENHIDELVRLIHEHGVKILTFSSNEPNLESVFFHLTNRELRD